MINLMEITYHTSGILAGIFLAGIVIMLFRKNKDLVRANIFLKYNQFRTSFLTAAIGSIIFIIGNLAGLISHNSLMIFHDTGEIIYNLAILIFAFLIFQIVKGKNG